MVSLDNIIALLARPSPPPITHPSPITHHPSPHAPVISSFHLHLFDTHWISITPCLHPPPAIKILLSTPGGPPNSLLLLLSTTTLSLSRSTVRSRGTIIYLHTPVYNLSSTPPPDTTPNTPTAMSPNTPSARGCSVRLWI
jgi:hypothetical protein